MFQLPLLLLILPSSQVPQAEEKKDPPAPVSVENALETFKQAMKKAGTAEEKALAIQALAAFPGRETRLVPPIARFLTAHPDDINFLIPTTAAEALGRFRGDGAAGLALVRALGAWKAVPYVHRRLFHDLGRVGHEAAFPIFEEILRGSDLGLGRAALKGLEAMPAGLSVELLFREMEKGKVYQPLRGEVLKLIHKLTGESYPTMEEMNIWWSKQGAAFKQKSAEREAGAPPPILSLPRLPPILLVELTFSDAGGNSTVNTGSSSAAQPRADVTSVSPARKEPSPPNAKPSLDWGIKPGAFAVDLGRVLEHLKGLKSFSVTGWISVRSSAEGQGGNRILSWCNNGRDGVDLVWRADGTLQLGVNQWAEASTARSKPGQFPVLEEEKPEKKAVESNWRFFAVTYDSTLETGHVKFYAGSRSADARLDSTLPYVRGPVGPKGGPSLSIGHVNPSARAAGIDRMFRGLIDEIRIFGSTYDGSGGLPLEQIITLQNRLTTPAPP